mmetsp:Transcript_16619/g.33632  ORF Transcript_16619/g.33632 Transcript_16619/m.33632 type:complete len:91 (+) Transcript_16619:75-347(+)
MQHRFWSVSIKQKLSQKSMKIRCVEVMLILLDLNKSFRMASLSLDRNKRCHCQIRSNKYYISSMKQSIFMPINQCLGRVTRDERGDVYFS